MTISSNGLEIIKYYESLKLKPYLCPAGKATIGYGNTYYEDGSKVSLSDAPITKERAEELLLNIANKFGSQVLSSLEKKINQNQFDAIVSFAFNVGIGNFRSSTLLKKLNKEDFAGVEIEFPKWNKSNGKVLNGLIARRNAEKELFLKGAK